MSNELSDTQMLLKKGSGNQITFSVKESIEHIWMSQETLSAFFEVSRSSIIKNLKTILDTLENKDSCLRRVSYVKEQLNRAQSVQETQYSFEIVCHLALILNSDTAIAFRLWMVQTHQRFVQTGFVCDRERVLSGEKRKQLWERTVNRITAQKR